MTRRMLGSSSHTVEETACLPCRLECTEKTIVFGPGLSPSASSCAAAGRSVLRKWRLGREAPLGPLPSKPSTLPSEKKPSTLPSPSAEASPSTEA
eukprot:scaffold71749_cov60-Phaeocystis_antarctica.AAC.3